MEFFARGGGLAEGHRPIEKYFIVLAFQMASGERRAFGRREGPGVEGSANRSLPAELIAYSENNVPYPPFSEGRAASRGHFFFFFFFPLSFGVFKKKSALGFWPY